MNTMYYIVYVWFLNFLRSLIRFDNAIIIYRLMIIILIIKATLLQHGERFYNGTSAFGGWNLKEKFV